MKIKRITLKLSDIDIATLAKIEKLVTRCGGTVTANSDGDDPPPQDPGGGDPPK